MFTNELGRSATQPDIDYWQGQLDTGTSLAAMRTSFADSIEATAAIQDAYQRGLDRGADAGQLAFWQGYLGGGGSIDVVRSWVFHCDEEAADITGLYQQLLGYTPTAAQVQFWEDNALSQGASLAQVKVALITSPEARVDFDAAYYLAQNPDVAASGMDPYLHYITVGWKEGRNPNAWFDTNYYLAQNPDVAASGVNPLLHYRLHGWQEGRNPSALFNTNAYLAANPDVAASGMDPLKHYLASGHAEGRAIYAAPPDPQLAMQQAAIDMFYYSMFARAATPQERGTVEMAVRAGQPIDQVLAGLRADPGFQATQTAVINAFYQQTWHRDANADELANIKAASAAGQSLLVIENTLHPTEPAPRPQDPATQAADALYQQVFGRDAFDQEVATFRAAMAAGATVQQIDDYLRPIFVSSADEDGLLKAVYKQVTGNDVDDTTLAQAKTDIQNGAWFADVRYGFAHTDAAAIAVDETFKDVLGRSASDAEVAIREDELSDTGTTGSMRTDLAQHDTADKIDRIYQEVLDRGATSTEMAGKQARLAAGETFGEIRAEVAHSADAVTEIDAVVFQETGLTDDLPTLAEIEAGLAAGATLDSIVSGQSGVLRLATAVSQDVSYDTQGDVTSFTNVLDPFKVERDVAYSFYQTLLGRPPSQDEVTGLKAALSLDTAPSTVLTMLDQNGHVLGQARADMLLIELPTFITLNDGVTPGLQVLGGLALNDGAQIAAFLVGMEGRSGRIDQKTITIYGEVTTWLDQVGQQLLQLTASMTSCYGRREHGSAGNRGGGRKTGYSIGCRPAVVAGSKFDDHPLCPSPHLEWTSSRHQPRD